MATLFRGIIILALAFAIAGILDLGLRPSSGHELAPTEESSAPVGEAPAVDQEAQTQAALDANDAAFEARDLDALMATYADDISIITPDETVNGKEAVRAMFEGLFNNMNDAGIASNVTMTRASGHMGYLVWEMTDADGNVTKGSDTFMVHDGLIMHQSVAYFADAAMAGEDASNGEEGAGDADTADAPADSDS